MYKLIFSIILTVSISLVGQTFLKKGVSAIDLKFFDFNSILGTLLKIVQNKLIIIGIFFSAIGAFFWLVALSKADLSFIFPIASGVLYVLLFLVSWLILGENINLWRIVGTILILIGVYTVLLFGK